MATLDTPRKRGKGNKEACAEMQEPRSIVDRLQGIIRSVVVAVNQKKGESGLDLLNSAREIERSGDHESARELYRMASFELEVEEIRSLGDTPSLIPHLGTAAEAARKSGDETRARDLFAKASHICEAWGLLADALNCAQEAMDANRARELEARIDSRTKDEDGDKTLQDSQRRQRESEQFSREEGISSGQELNRAIIETTKQALTTGNEQERQQCFDKLKKLAPLIYLFSR